MVEKKITIKAYYTACKLAQFLQKQFITISFYINDLTFCILLNDAIILILAIRLSNPRVYLMKSIDSSLRKLMMQCHKMS